MSAKRNVIVVVYRQSLRKAQDHPAVGRGRAGPDKHFQIPSAGYEDATECGAMIQGHRKRHHPSVVDRRQSELVEKAAA